MVGTVADGLLFALLCISSVSAHIGGAPIVTQSPCQQDSGSNERRSPLSMGMQDGGAAGQGGSLWADPVLHTLVRTGLL